MTDDNTKNTLMGNGGMSYFNRISSGDIGIENINSNGDNTRKLKIPMIAYANNNRVTRANMAAINERKRRMTTEAKPEATEATETFYQNIDDVYTDELGHDKTDYVVRERFTTDNENMALISFVAILLWVVVAVFIYFAYIKYGTLKLPQYTSNN